MLKERDLSSRARVCVIGQTIVDNLFPEGDAVGKTLRINKAPFQVIGVLEAKGQSAGGQDQDDVVYIPLTTAQNRMMGITHINRITIQAENENVIDQVQGEVEQLLRQRHKIKAGDDDDFTVRNLAALMETMMETANTITLLLGCIAAISLLVGGIGIMNIMLVSVTESTWSDLQQYSAAVSDRSYGDRRCRRYTGCDFRYRFLLCYQLFCRLANGDLHTDYYHCGGILRWHWFVLRHLSCT